MAPTRPSKSSSRPSKSGPSAASKTPATKSSSAGVKKPVVPAPKSKTKSAPLPPAHDEDVDDDAGDADDAPRPFRANRLKPRIRSVPRRVVSEKWVTLSDACQEDVMASVKLAERGVLMSFPNERTKAQAQVVTQKLIAIFRKKLEKIPVPPTGKDARLSREYLVERNGVAEAALEPTLCEIAELEKELEKEKELLRQDQEHLEELKKNAKAHEKVRAEKSRMMPRALRMDPDAAPAPEINLSDEGDLYEAASSYKPESDRHIRVLVEQFEGHLQTMHGNVSILGEVPDWVWKARTSVEEVIDRVDGNLFHTMVGV